MSRGKDQVRGIEVPGRRPTLAYPLLIVRRMGIPILLACMALDLLVLLLLG
ncbi:MAG: hypothetical protein ACO3DJ_19890 [Alphaproteobacteria bacterium]|jgi:hypothetical protein